MEQPFWPPSGQNGKATLTTKWSKRLWHCDSWWAKLQSLFYNLVAQTPLFRMLPREAKSTEVFWRAAPARLQPVLLVTW